MRKPASPIVEAFNRNATIHPAPLVSPSRSRGIERASNCIVNLSRRPMIRKERAHSTVSSLRFPDPSRRIYRGIEEFGFSFVDSVRMVNPRAGLDSASRKVLSARAIVITRALRHAWLLVPTEDMAGEMRAHSVGPHASLGLLQELQSGPHQPAASFALTTHQDTRSSMWTRQCRKCGAPAGRGGTSPSSAARRANSRIPAICRSPSEKSSALK